MADSLSPEQMSAMMGTGGGAQQQTPQTDTSAQPEWLKAMMDSSLQPSQSAAVLGHSTGMMDNFLKGTGAVASTMLPNPQNSLDQGIGGIKSIGDTMAGAARFGETFANQTAGRVVNAAQGNGFNPLSNEQLGNSTANPDSQVNKNIDSALSSTNDAQTLGKTMGNIGQTVIPIGEGTSAIKNSGVLSKIGDMTGVTDWLAKRATNKAVNAVASTADTMSKAEREAAIAEGRQQAGFLNNSFAPSKTEARAGELLTGKIGGNPIKNVPVVQSEIAARGKEAETFLQANAKPITNQEDFNAFAKQREVSSTYLTPTAEKAYDEQMNVFQKVLKGYVKDGGYNTSNYYQALKEFESNVTQNLPKGKEALLDEGGSARLQAAKDVRHVVRDMIGSKNPEFKDKMFDLASLYDARDNVITKAEKSGHGLQQLIKKYPKTSGAIGALGGLEANKTLKDWTGIGF